MSKNIAVAVAPHLISACPCPFLLPPQTAHAALGLCRIVVLQQLWPSKPEVYTAGDTTRTMRRQCRRAVVASLAVLPAVESLCAPAACCRQTTLSNRWISGAVRWAGSSISSTWGPTRAEYALSVSGGTLLRMQGGDGYEGGGEGKLDAIK